MNFIDYFLNIALPKEKNRIFLEAEGGFGKSTSLRYLCKELIKIEKVVPIYIECKKLNNYTVEQLIVHEYCGQNVSGDSFDNMLKKETKNKFIFMFDSFNEVKEETCEKVLDFCDLYKRNSYKNVYIVIASRKLGKFYQTKFKEDGYSFIRLLPLNTSNVQTMVNQYLSSVSASLLQVLCNPMMLNVFLKARNKTVYLDVTTQSELLNIYFNNELNVLFKTKTFTNFEKISAQFMIRIFLPTLFKDCQQYCFSVKEIDDYIRMFKIDDDSVFLNEYYEKYYGEIRCKYSLFKRFLLDFLSLFRQNGTILTIHQIYADYFIVKWYEKAIETWINMPNENPRFLFKSLEPISFQVPTIQVKKNLYELVGTKIKDKIPDILRENHFKNEKYIMAFVIEVLRTNASIKDCDFSELALECCKMTNRELNNVNLSNTSISKDCFFDSFDTNNINNISIVYEWNERVFLMVGSKLYCYNIADCSIEYSVFVENKKRLVISDDAIVVGKQSDIYIFDLRYGFIKKIIKNIFIDEYIDSSLLYDIDFNKYILFSKQSIKVLDCSFQCCYTSSISQKCKLKNVNGKILCFDGSNIKILTIVQNSVAFEICVDNSASEYAYVAFLDNSLTIIYQKNKSENIALYNCETKKQFEISAFFNDLIPFYGCYQHYRLVNFVTYDNSDSIAIDALLQKIDDEIIELLCEEEYINKEISNKYPKLNKTNQLIMLDYIYSLSIAQNKVDIHCVFNAYQNKKQLMNNIIQLQNTQFCFFSDNLFSLLNYHFELMKSETILQNCIPIDFHYGKSVDKNDNSVGVDIFFNDFDISFDFTKKKVLSIHHDNYNNAVCVPFYEQFSLYKDINLNFDTITCMPRKLHMGDKNGNIIKTIGKYSLETDLIDPKLFFNAIYNNKIIATLYGVILKDCQLNLKKIFNHDVEYINEYRDEIGNFSPSNYKKQKEILLVVCHYDIQQEKLLIDEDLTNIINPKTHMLLPTGYREIDENSFFFTTKIMKTDTFCFGIHDRNTKETITFNETLNQESYIKTLKENNNIYIVFSKSVIVFNCGNRSYNIYVLPQTIQSITKGEKCFYVLYNRTKLGKLIFGKGKCCISHIVGLYPQLNVKKCLIDNIQEINNDLDFVSDLKWYFAQ